MGRPIPGLVPHVVSATALLVIAVSQAALDNDSGHAAPLCTVKEWFGGKAQMTGTMVNDSHNVTKEMTIYYYSALKQKLVAYPMFKSKKLIYDYPNHWLYTITYTNPGLDSSCQKTPLPGHFLEVCVPGNRVVTVDPHTSFGAGAAMTYGWEASSTQGTLRRRFTMSNNMLPMFEETIGLMDGVPYFQNVFYYNTSQVTFSDNTFKIPANCP